MKKNFALSYSKGIPGRAIDVIKNEQVKKIKKYFIRIAK